MNSLLFSFVKLQIFSFNSVSRIFRHKMINGQFDCHNVEITEILSHFFRKNFVKALVLLKKLLNRWFDEIFFQWERFSRFFTLCHGKIAHFWQKIRENNAFTFYLHTKELIWRNNFFLRVNFSFTTLHWLSGGLKVVPIFNPITRLQRYQIDSQIGICFCTLRQNDRVPSGNATVKL